MLFLLFGIKTNNTVDFILFVNKAADHTHDLTPASPLKKPR